MNAIPDDPPSVTTSLSSVEELDDIPVIRTTAAVENCPHCGRVLVWPGCRFYRARDVHDPSREITVRICSYDDCRGRFTVIQLERNHPPPPSQLSGRHRQVQAPAKNVSEFKRPHVLMRFFGFLVVPFIWLFRLFIKPPPNVDTTALPVAFKDGQRGYACGNLSCSFPMDASPQKTVIDRTTNRKVRIRRCGKCGTFYREPEESDKPDGG